MAAKFADRTAQAIPVHVIEAGGLESWCADQSGAVRTWVTASGFKARLGQTLMLPTPGGDISAVLYGWGDGAARRRGRLQFGAAANSLPEGIYKIASGLSQDELGASALAWLLASYRFTKYKKAKTTAAQLVAPDGVDAARLEVIAAGAALTLDLINTPTSDMGPDALEAAFLDLASRHGAAASVIRGDDLLVRNFPMIHAVGRASDQEPRLLDLVWGSADAPKVTLVGKGVCFDTGGLDIKPPASMGLMKKDMGGGATVMGLAQIIMALGLNVRLRVLVPAVENSISAGAFRPQDVLTSRKGLTVEINNTDAEGRLVLADALAFGDEESPDLMLCMATLTGAARVALGPDLPPFYSDDEGLVSQITASAAKTSDPLWRMPFWDPYDALIEPDIADLDNAPKGGMAGSITAALFLRRFVEKAASFAHFDIYGWTPEAKPARPKGGAFQGARALLGVIEAMAGPKN